MAKRSSKTKDSENNKFFIKNRKICLFFLIIFISALISYLNIFRSGFVDWDDNSYITENKNVLKGLTLENIKWAFTNLSLGFYYPVTWISHLIDVSLFGLRPWGHHLTSLIIHIFNSFLIFAILRKAGIEEIKSFFISLIFTVHPLNVESVAWISERKNLLAAFFFFFGIFFYIDYLKTNRMLIYVKSMFAYLLGIMSKPILVMFPFTLILIDILIKKESNDSHKFFKEKWKAIFINKIPFLIIIPLFTYLTIIAQKRIAALGNTTFFPMEQRIINAIYSYSKYIFQFLFPLKLSAFYPHIKDNYDTATTALYILLMAGIFLMTVFLWKKNKVYLIGFLWFFINLFPVIGIIQVGSQGSADRYMYIPMIGLLMIFVEGVYAFFERIKIHFKYAVVLLSIVVFLFGIKTFKQSKVWMNSDNLFANMINESSNPSQGYVNLGLIYKAKGNYVMEAEYSRKAIEADNKCDSAYNNLGDALLRLGDIQGAKDAFEKANRLNPDHPVTIGNLGYAEELLGNIDKAKEYYKKALEINKYYSIVRIKLIYLLEKENNIDEAIKHCEIGDKLSHEAPDFLRLKCALLLTPRRYDELKTAAAEGIRRFPEEKQFPLAYGEACLNLGELEEAEKSLKKIEDSSINNGIVFERLSEIKLRQNKIEEARSYMEKALQMDRTNKFYIDKMAYIMKIMENNTNEGKK